MLNLKLFIWDETKKTRRRRIGTPLDHSLQAKLTLTKMGDHKTDLSFDLKIRYELLNIVSKIWKLCFVSLEKL